MPSYEPAKKNTAYIFYVGLVSQADTKLLQVNPTIAAGDFKVSVDGAALANPTTLPAVTPAGSRMVKISLSTSEMNGDNITVVASDAAGAEWCDALWNIPTVARQMDDLAFPATSGRPVLVDANGNIAIQAQFKKGVALLNFEFMMYSSTTGQPATGLTVTPTRSIDGAAFGACTNAVSAVSGGLYKIDLSTSDLNGNVITLAFAATGAKTTIITLTPAP